MRHLFIIGAATLALGALVTPAKAQSVQSLIANQLQSDGTFLWSYKVTSGSWPTINYWTLGMGENVYSDIASVSGSSNYGYTTSGLDGIRFEEDYSGGQSRTISFRLTENYGVTTGSAAIRSGTNTKTVSLVTPGLRSSSVPEPHTLALAGLVGLPLLRLARRRS